MYNKKNLIRACKQFIREEKRLTNDFSGTGLTPIKEEGAYVFPEDAILYMGYDYHLDILQNEYSFWQRLGFCFNLVFKRLQ